MSRLSPSLVPFQTKEEDISGMQGLSLKNVTFTVTNGKRRLFHEMGELMFTHFGVTGPLILRASALLQDQIAKGRLQRLDRPETGAYGGEAGRTDPQGI